MAEDAALQRDGLPNFRTSIASAIVAWLLAFIPVSAVWGQQPAPAFDPLTADFAPDRLDPSLFAYDSTQPLDVKVQEVHRLGDVDVDELTYESPGPGRVPAYLYHPPQSPVGSSPVPALILMHGLPGTRGQLGRLAVAYARAGVWVLTISAPYSRFDLPYREPVLMGAPRFDEYDRREGEQVIMDLRRAVDLLIGIRGVDSKRIGYVGFSMGGGFGALMAAVEPRLRAVALMAPTSGLVTWVHTRQLDHPIGTKFEQLGPEGRARWTREMWEVEPVRWLARAQPVPLLIQGGLLDGTVTRGDTERLIAAAPRSVRVKWYETGHNLDARAYQDQAAFLAEPLGFDLSRFVAPSSLF